MATKKKKKSTKKTAKPKVSSSAKKKADAKKAAEKKSSSKAKSVTVKDAKGKSHTVKEGSNQHKKYLAQTSQSSAPKPTSSSATSVSYDQAVNNVNSSSLSAAQKAAAIKSLGGAYSTTPAPKPAAAPEATQLPYEDAVKNLETGGLQGDALNQAKASLDSAYKKTPTPQVIPPAPVGPPIQEDTAAQLENPGEVGAYTPPETTVSSYQDNPDGTTTNYTADGGKDTGTYSKNNDGSLTFKPQSSPQVPQTPSYTGGSIVDFLNQSGQKSDFASRSQAAAQYGIRGYTGTAQQNTQLLNAMRTGQPPQVDTTPSTAVQPPTATTTTGVPTAAAPQDMLSSYGYALTSGAQQSFQIAPAKSFQEVYNGVYKSIGLGDVKKNIDKTMKDITKLDDELAEKTADINENPWLTEGVRVSQVRKLEERYDLKRAPYASNLTTLEDIYNNGRDEARYVATQTLNQYNQERQFQMDQIQAWQDAAERLYEAQYRAQKDSSDAAYRERQFAEDVRQFGVSESIQRYNAETSRISANKSGGGGGGTLEERQAAALAAFGETFSPGVRMADGTPAVDANGFITPVAWKAALSKASAVGLKRSDVISEFGGMIFHTGDVIPSSYGISPAEAKLILGS